MAAGIRPTVGDRAGIAPGYRRAMHALCIGCHADQRKPGAEPVLERCATCHGSRPGAPDASGGSAARGALVAVLELP